MPPDIISDHWLGDRDIFKDNSTELLCVEHQRRCTKRKQNVILISIPKTAVHVHTSIIFHGSFT